MQDRFISEWSGSSVLVIPRFWPANSGVLKDMSQVTSSSNACHTEYEWMACLKTQNAVTVLLPVLSFHGFFSSGEKKQCNYNWSIFNNCATLNIFIAYTEIFLFISTFKNLTQVQNKKWIRTAFTGKDISINCYYGKVTVIIEEPWMKPRCQK